MSFVSGIMMGAAIGRNIHEMIGGKKRWTDNHLGKKVWNGSCNGSKGAFLLVSQLPGRRRYRIGALVNNKSMADCLAKELKKTAHISKVEVNHLTGSLLLEYSMSEGDMNLIISRLRTKVTNTASCGCHMGSHAGKSPVLYAANWNNTVEMVNNKVRALTYGWFDMSTLLSVFFLIRGLRKMLLYGQRPSGPTMVWWALHMMKGRRK